MRQGSGPTVPDDAAVVDDFLELSGSGTALSGYQICLPVYIQRIKAGNVHNERNLAQRQQQVQFAHGDATRSDAYEDSVPCQLILACGVLGNIAPETTASFIALASAACAHGGTFIWTRLLSANNGAAHTTVIRRLLDAAGFDE